MPRSTSHETSLNTEQTITTAVNGGNLSAGGAENLRRWLWEPQYAIYRDRLLELINDGSFEQLDALFWMVIPFGTGGRRGPMAEFGSATINERTIAESAHGVAVHLKRQKTEAPLRAVVAYDTRNRSDEFARLTATTWAAHGLKVFLFESFRSTPELSFAVRRLECDVGAMVSASHNPPGDNGFKAYWSTGGQVLPPHDRGMIDCVYNAGEIPAIDFNDAVAAGQIELVGREIDREYIDAVAGLSLSEAREIPALFTPLHGVGESSVAEVLRIVGFRGVEILESQRKPDGNFTNVPDQLPNPERSEVYQPAIAHALKSGAELILASDPDADRLGVCVKAADGQFVHLSGNRVGALLADYILGKRAAAGTLSAENYVVETLVTTPLISEIAKSYGVRAIDNLLVGFKYIAQTIDREGPERFVYGAEESLGYLAGTYCRDKDASVAALYIMELAAELRRDGKTLLDRLDELYSRHGYHVEGQRSEVCPGARGQEQIAELMRRFRRSPPQQLGEISLNRVRDYSMHEIRKLPENVKVEELPDPDGELLIFEADSAGCQLSIAVRPSGTEPKIKFYFFARCAGETGLSPGQPISSADPQQAPADRVRAKPPMPGCPGRESLKELKVRTDRTLEDMQDAFSALVKRTFQDAE